MRQELKPYASTMCSADPLKFKVHAIRSKMKQSPCILVRPQDIDHATVYAIIRQLADGHYVSYTSQNTIHTKASQGLGTTWSWTASMDTNNIAPDRENPCCAQRGVGQPFSLFLTARLKDLTSSSRGAHAWNHRGSGHCSSPLRCGWGPLR